MPWLRHRPRLSFTVAQVLLLLPLQLWLPLLHHSLLLQLPHRQNALATTLVQPLVALVQADYYPRVVATAFTCY
jgi:hypothetical protein